MIVETLTTRLCILQAGKIKPNLPMRWLPRSLITGLVGIGVTRALEGHASLTKPDQSQNAGKMFNDFPVTALNK
jgi:hypothetical protein